MWIVTGPFDGETSNEVGFQKSKLLKSGKSYLIGRKSTTDLVVNHKKVSHDHGQFIVGGFSPDDVTNTDYAPTLRILNSKNKTMRILREGVPNGVIVNPGATEQLQHDDQVDIVSGLPLTVQWRRICCFETPGKVRTPVPVDGYASIGVHIVRMLHPDITHHLIPSYALTPAHMTSLLSAAQLVKPEWLSDLLELSILNPHESQRALEYTFALPPEGKYRPAFVATLPTALKTFKTWEPNETRINMLKGYRFVFVGDKGLEIPAGYRDLVKRGGADYEAFSVNAGVVRWRKALLRAKALAEEKNGKAVPVADGGAMELAVGAEEWEEMVSVVKSLGLEFIQPENILQAVAFVDTFYVDSARAANSQAQGSGESSLPDVVPNTFSGEPSNPPPVQRENPPKATRPSPTTSEQPPPAAASPPEATGVSIPRRLPPRRAMGTNHTAPSPGPADDVAIVAATPTPVPPLAPVQGDAALGGTQLPTPVSQTRRLPPRRRANQGIGTSSALMSGSSHARAPQSQFSQLDKYKALFDASNPDRVPSDETQLGTGTGMSTQGVRASTLSAVPEEGQESQAQPTGLRGTKRSRGAGDGNDNDAEMAGGAGDATGTSADTLAGAHRAKRRAVDAIAVPAPAPAPAPQPRSTQTQTQTQATGTTGTKQATKPPSSKSSTNNKLDTDENFLKAVNSTKRGKKLEDDFDREFNLLRIAKPKKVDGAGTGGAATAAAAGPVAGAPDIAVAPWDAIDDFGDVGIRGNFMVVVEMDIERGSAKPSQPACINDDITTHPEWVGRPNFKKFKSKKTAAIERRQTIELVISEENDYGIGNAYWRSAASGSQSYSDVHDITAAHPPPLHSKSKSKPPSKASRAPTSSRGGPARAPASEDEVTGVDLDADEMGLDDAPAPPPKPASTRGRPGTRAKAPASAAAAKKPTSKTKPTATAKAKAKSTTAKTKTKRSPARTKKAPTAVKGGRRKNAQAQALFLSDDDSEDEDEFVVGGEDEMNDDMPVAVDESAAAVAAVLGVGEDDEEEVEKGDETMTRGTNTFAHGGRAASAVGDDERVDIGTTATLRSTAGTQSRREAVRAAKRRAAAMGGGDDDDSDDAVFKGFGGRKKGRVR